MAKLHEIKHEMALICHDAPLETSDSSEGTVKWCRLQGGQWKRFRALPLTDKCPPWPPEPEPKNEKTNETEVRLVSCRVVYCKEFLHQSEWKNALRKPNDALMKCFPARVHFRSYGWNHNPTPKEESIIGYLNIPAKEDDSLPFSRSCKLMLTKKTPKPKLDGWKEENKTQVLTLLRHELLPKLRG